MKPNHFITKHKVPILILVCVVISVILIVNYSLLSPTQNLFLQVGASYMTFYGTETYDDWPSGVVYHPSLGNYNSSNATIAGQQIQTALNHGIDFFFLDYGWGNDTEKTLMENAAINGIIAVTEANKDFHFCVFYFPNWHVNNISPTIDATGIAEDFSHISQTYFKYQKSYLRLNNKPVVILADFPKYLNQNLTITTYGENPENWSYQEINRLFSNITRTYNLFLIPALWPFWQNYTLQCEVLANAQIQNPPSYMAITLWGDTTIIKDWNTEDNYQNYAMKTENAFANWSATAMKYNVGFVPLICPGYDNRIYYNGTSYHGGRPGWYAIVDRDATPNLEYWSQVWQAAETNATAASNKCHLVLIFTWNDFKEGTSIEPTAEYDSKYLDVIFHK